MQIVFHMVKHIWGLFNTHILWLFIKTVQVTKINNSHLLSRPVEELISGVTWAWGSLWLLHSFANHSIFMSINQRPCLTIVLYLEVGPLLCRQSTKCHLYGFPEQLKRWLSTDTGHLEMLRLNWLWRTRGKIFSLLFWPHQCVGLQICLLNTQRSVAPVYYFN